MDRALNNSYSQERAVSGETRRCDERPACQSSPPLFTLRREEKSNHVDTKNGDIMEIAAREETLDSVSVFAFVD